MPAPPSNSASVTSVWRRKEYTVVVLLPPRTQTLKYLNSVRLQVNCGR